MMLNSAQTEAAGYIDGPLMIIAGPGTGKTQLLSARVGTILKQTDQLPENILCMTYTDAATIAMRRRLISFMGSEAYRVPIFTFHAFCQKVITEFQFEMGISQLEPVSEMEAIKYMQWIIDQWEISNPLRNFKAPYHWRKDLLKLNQILKQEKLSRELLLDLIQKEIEELPYRDEMRYKRRSGSNQVGDIKKNDLKIATEKYQRMAEAVKTCFEYRALLQNERRYDFDDMILWVIDLFKSHPYALVRYQEQFQYIMVDEYQDTNKAQNELIMLLASYWESPNLMVVGDDDQSIYRFQGANIENLHAFQQRYQKDLKQIVLTENYRSDQKILDAAEQLIARNSLRLIAEKKLKSAGPHHADEPPQVIECPNEMYEALEVYNRVVYWKSKGVPYSEMAVIYRNHANAERIKSCFEYFGIPVVRKRKSDVLQMPFIQNILEILCYIADERAKPYSGDFRLFKILHFDFWQIYPHDLAKLALNIRSNKAGWRETLNSLKSRTELKNLLEPDTNGKLIRVASDLEYWVGKSFNLPLQQLVEKVISKGGILSFVLQSAQKRFLLQCLQTFFDFLKNETRKNPELTLEKFIETLDLMRTNKVLLEAEEIIEHTEGVNLITAHSSKGLEFDKVFLVGCNEKIWDKDKDRLPFDLRKLFSSDDKGLAEENRRLFYVACTRAKTGLYLMYHAKSLKNEDLQESALISEFLESGIPTKIKSTVPDDQILELQASVFGLDTPDTDFEPLAPEFLQSFTENYVLSATHLDNYLDCPVKFYYRNLLQIPSAKTAPLSFGNAIHKALEQFFKSMKAHPNHEYPDLNALVSWFRNDLLKNRDSFTNEDFDRYMAEGSEKVLPQLYQTFLGEWQANKNRIPEKNLSDIVVNTVPIKGKLDQLVFLDENKVHVVDFKTGKFRPEKKKLLSAPVLTDLPENPSKEQQYGGDYWRQVAFYHLLLNNDPLHHYQTVSGEMFFVEPTETGEFIRQTITVQKEELHFMERLIKEVYDKITRHEFSKGCGKPECEWCTFNAYYINHQRYGSESLMSDTDE